MHQISPIYMSRSLLTKNHLAPGEVEAPSQDVLYQALFAIDMPEDREDIRSSLIEAIEGAETNSQLLRIRHIIEDLRIKRIPETLLSQI